VNLQSPEGRLRAEEILQGRGIDWCEMEEALINKRNQKDKNRDSDELSSYDVIVGDNCFFELEELDERVLYDFPEIARRANALREKIAIDDLKLLPYYDRLRRSSYLTSEDVICLLTNTCGERVHTTDERESIELYRKLERYDRYLDEIADIHQELSYADLTQPVFMEKIGPILGLDDDGNDHYNSRPFRKMYQRRNLFPSPKDSDLSLYEGIWYDDDNHYFVGSNSGMKAHGQANSYAIRHFDIYKGQDQFDILPLLRTTSVQFVRFKQYTVYPYPFHLINVYAESVLQFEAPVPALDETE
jgi:hypothetical protein